jgi:acetyltransferase-like isoleucine patch superfamily enzyme
MLKKKLFKTLAKILPGNAIRVRLLKACGYRIGKNVYIGEDLIIIDDLADPACRLSIGDRASLAPRITLVMHSAPNESRIRNYIKEQKGTIVIKQDAWIGSGAVIAPNIEIGEGAIVGANSFVDRNVPDYVFVGGVPARVIKTVKVPWREESMSGESP